MVKKTFHIPNISCSHCIQNIKNELDGLEGVSGVEGDPIKKEITVEFNTPETLEIIREVLRDINYPPTD